MLLFSEGVDVAVVATDVEGVARHRRGRPVDILSRVLPQRLASVSVEAGHLTNKYDAGSYEFVSDPREDADE